MSSSYLTQFGQIFLFFVLGKVDQITLFPDRNLGTSSSLSANSTR
ncbi:hypothetical protein ABID29_001238 [Streptococcus rupicaprae]|uniref:Uncharacterized protein n=1 Tax=Streptococcus rupicaprae TaxID=759619 RepID=A0ABV2FHW1_9STRE